MDKKVFRTAAAPAPIGPYSQAVAAGGLLFVSGQIALDPQSGELRSTPGGNIREETRLVMENLRAILTEAGSDFGAVVKSTIFLMDMADFAAVNEVYGSFLSEPFPARETVQVAGLPRGVRVEISVVATLGSR